MKKISLILAIILVLGVMFSFASCTGSKPEDEPDKEASEAIDPKDAVLADMVAAIEEKAPYKDYISEVLYMAEDPSEMVKWTYGVVDIKGSELLSDYAITMYSDYAHTLAILKFDDGMTEADIAEVKDAVAREYIRARASALQMYMPDEYKVMDWAEKNPDKIWRQYGDNMLVLAIYGGEEPTVVWDAIDSYLAGK